MVRMFVCAALGLLLVAGVGLAGEKAKGKGKKGTRGTFESYKDGTLTIQTKGKKGTPGEKKEFKVADDTSVTVLKGEDKSEVKAFAAFKDVAVGTPVTVTTDKSGAVTGIQVGGSLKKKKK